MQEQMNGNTHERKGVAVLTLRKITWETVIFRAVISLLYKISM